MIGRYTFTPKVNQGKAYSTQELSSKIYYSTISGLIPYQTRLLREGERLDTIAGKAYGDGTLWWVIAACSGIGWGLQVPPGTLLKVPTDISKVLALMR